MLERERGRLSLNTVSCTKTSMMMLPAAVDSTDPNLVSMACWCHKTETTDGLMLYRNNSVYTVVWHDGCMLSGCTALKVTSGNLCFSTDDTSALFFSVFSMVIYNPLHF